MISMDEMTVSNSKAVMYNNAFNRANLGGLSPVASNLLMLIARDVRDKGTQEITFSDSDLTKDYLVGRGHRTKKDVSWALFSISTSLLKITAPIQEGTKIKVKSVFKEFSIETKEGYQDKRLVVSVNEEYLFLFNELAKNFTVFQLQEFARLRTTRSKTLYRLLKQYRTQGWLYLKVDDIFKLFFKFERMSDYEAIEYYRKNKRYIKKQVLELATNECKKYFDNLELTVIKDEHRRGKPITGFKWTFSAEQIKQKSTGQIGSKRKSRASRSVAVNGYSDYSKPGYDYDDLERQLANSPNN